MEKKSSCIYIFATIRTIFFCHFSFDLWLTMPDHADWLYKTGEKAKVEVCFCLYGMPQNVEVNYEIGPDMMPTTSRGKVMLKNGRATIDMGTMKQPDSTLA